MIVPPCPRAPVVPQCAPETGKCPRARVPHPLQGARALGTPLAREIRQKRAPGFQDQQLSIERTINEHPECAP